MGKVVFISEKPSVAQQFADALGIPLTRRDGYMEGKDTIITWCLGHLVTMSYPEAYDPKLKRWSMDTLPFLPKEFRYEVINDGGTKKQYNTVRNILTSKDVDRIYICTDSGREGEYIYRLVAKQAGVHGKEQKRVWIDSQTKEEILRGIREAKDDSAYDNLGAAAYLRAKEDYLMGINFSRALTLKYRYPIADFLGMDRCVIAVGRVMTCVLGIVVRREREIRAFVPTPFFRVVGTFGKKDAEGNLLTFTADWSAVEGSRCFQSPKLYRDNGFLKREDAEELITYLTAPGEPDNTPRVDAISHKKEVKNPPTLYNLAELQNDCSRYFKISPDQTLAIAQELYEKKLTTYPRTDARVLSSAVAKVIDENLNGVSSQPMFAPYVKKILASGTDKKIGKTKYTNDAMITDHYAIIPTGQGFSALPSLSPTSAKVYELIVRRFLAIFYPPAIFDKISLSVRVRGEHFGTSQKVLKDPGYLEVNDYSFRKKKGEAAEEQTDTEGAARETVDLSKVLEHLKKGDVLSAEGYEIREGQTQPPKRYNSGSLILTMENAGQFIEDETLREQIKGSGIGTSATRADILKKLVTNRYLDLNAKTQIYTPTQLGEMIYDVCDCSIRSLLDPKLTASWEMGLSRVAEGTVTEDEYMEKLEGFITRRTNHVKETNYTGALRAQFEKEAPYYPRKMNFSKTRYAGKGNFSSGKTAPKKSTGTRTGKTTANRNKAENKEVLNQSCPLKHTVSKTCSPSRRPSQKSSSPGRPIPGRSCRTSGTLSCALETRSRKISLRSAATTSGSQRVPTSLTPPTSQAPASSTRVQSSASAPSSAARRSSERSASSATAASSRTSSCSTTVRFPTTTTSGTRSSASTPTWGQAPSRATSSLTGRTSSCMTERTPLQRATGRWVPSSATGWRSAATAS